VNGQAAYTMQVGGVNVSPQSSNHMIVSLNGTIQKPGGANPSFTVSGSTITFASNLATGDVIDFIQILGDVLDLGVPSDSTVSLAKLTATGTKDATTFLRGDNTFAEAGGGKILQIVMGTTSTAVGTDSTSYIDTGLTASITPASSSNKVLVLVSQIATIIQSTSTTRDTFFNLVRGSTQLFQNFSQTISPTGTTRFHVTNSMNYLDTPSTSSATTYKTQVKGNGANWDIYLQKDSISQSQIILMEVAG
jgi:hypothetical protein